jgi:type I restriction enzyme R subunit
VLYVNGIALGVIELKRSTVAVSEGIRQNLDNQKAEFIEDFFTTVQLVMAGSETEGLRYGVIGTREKYYLIWTDTDPLYREVGNPLLRDLGRLCSPRRFLELIHDFMAYDAGTKKTSRHNQYFGVRAAQDRIRMREGGIIWHTQGSGKSLTMVWLARWIWEHVTDARVLIVTDRKELDEQIENVFMGVGEKIRRTRSGDDLVRELKDKKNWLLCSLIHKFGTGDELRKADLDAFIAEIAGALGREFKPAGNFFIFVDECHRTQSGELHDAMKRLLPDALFIGFTGTPLLAQDKVSSIQKFGGYIHTYKYDEAVRDGVVLDLRYEARDIDQSLASQTRSISGSRRRPGLTDYARPRSNSGGTMQKVPSARTAREDYGDILMDMETKTGWRADGATASSSATASTRPAASSSPSTKPTSKAAAPSSPPTPRSGEHQGRRNG